MGGYNAGNYRIIVTREEVSGGVGLGGAFVNNSTPILIRSVLGIPSAGVRNSIRRTGRLTTTNYRMVHFTVPSRTTLSLVRPVGGTISIPLITSVRFSCHLTLKTTRENVSGVEVGPNGVNSRSHIGTITSVYERGRVPVHVNMGDNDLRGRVLTGCNSPAPSTVIRSTLCRTSLLRGFSFSGVIVSVGSSSMGAVVTTCRLTTREYSCPLRLNIARTNARHVNVVGSTVNVNSLLGHKVNSAVQMDLSSSPIGRIFTTFSVLGTLNLGGSYPCLVSYPAYKHAEVSLVNLTGRIRRELHSYGGPVGITIVNYVMGNPKRTGRTSVNVTNNSNYNLVFGGKRVLHGIPRGRLLSRLVGRVSGLW